MPLVDKTIHATDYFSNKNITNCSESTNIVKNQDVSKLFGSLKQLIELTNYSHILFSDLSTLTSKIGNRIVNLSERTEILISISKENEKRIAHPEVKFEPSSTELEEKMIVRTVLQYPATNDLMDRQTLPYSLRNVLHSSDMLNIPPLAELDHYGEYFIRKTAINSIAERYSNPNFFFYQWVMAENKRLAALEEEKRQQKADRKIRKKKQATINRHPKSKKKNSISWQDR
jgi:hypothetical protein